MKDSNEIAAEALGMALRATGRQDPSEDGGWYTDLIIARAERFRKFLGGERAESANPARAYRLATTADKPEEPMGLGAVVRDFKGEQWVRGFDALAPWVGRRGPSVPWSAVPAVRVLSEGVTP